MSTELFESSDILVKNTSSEDLNILIISENASMRMGGESSLPFYYFKFFRKQNLKTWLISHARVREELQAAFSQPEDWERIYFVEDNWLQIFLWKFGQKLPYRIKDLIVGQLIHIITQYKVRKLAKKLVSEKSINIIFEPAPISPKGISFMYNMGAPVVIGPLCGGLEFPPAFRYMDSRFSQIFVFLARTFSQILNRLIPGKLEATTLIVANERTKNALPKGYQGKVYEVVESGVDLSIWGPVEKKFDNQLVRFAYSGRFIDWKGVKFLVEAFAKIASDNMVKLELIGDGELRKDLEEQVLAFQLQEKVVFHGWLSRNESSKIIQECDAFVMPSLRECGGTAILEAMAIGLPVIATNWAGPALYLDENSGILVEPSSEQEFVEGLAKAIVKLSQSPELRSKMGQCALDRVHTNYFTWEAKINRVVEIFLETLKSDSLSTNSKLS